MKTLEFIKLNESGANNVVASLQQLLSRLPSVLHQSPWFPLEHQRT